MKHLALLAVVLLAGCGGKESGQGPDAARRVVPEGATWVEVVSTSMPARVDVIGTVASEKTITLSSRLNAYVQEVFVAAGDRVKSGQLLMTLDDRELREQFVAAESQFKQAEREFQRVQGLFDKNAATEQAVTAAEASFVSAKARMEGVKVMLSYAQVASPIDGVVTERRLESGDLANPGSHMLTVYDPSRMRLEASVPVRLIPRLSLGNKVEVTLDQRDGTLPGEVTEIVSEVDPLSRTRKVKIRLESAGDLLPGTFGRIWVEDEARPMITVPAEAVTRVGQLEMVKVDKGGEPTKRLVRTGPRRGAEVEILSGLDAGERVLVPQPAGS